MTGAKRLDGLAPFVAFLAIWHLSWALVAVSAGLLH